MSSRKASGRLSAAERASLLGTMRTERPAAVEAGPVERTRNYDVAFDTLPGFRMLKSQRALGDFLGLSNPFYRMHDERSGAVAEIDGRVHLNFSSYDYLGLNGHPEITAAVTEAAARWGTSVSASRLTAGERSFHRDLERGLADLYETEDCLSFVSGHATNVSVIASIVGPRDLIVHDSLAHNSILVGAELSRAHRRSFAHNDLDALEALLAGHRDRHERCLIVSEGLFSMDGDMPDLARLIAIKERWGAWLMIDEAHSLGVLGATGRGVFEEQGIDPKGVDLWMGTLSKTLVGCGGYIAGSATLIEYLKFQASGMVYSVGMPAPIAVASSTALALMRREPERVARLQANGRHFLEAARAAGLDTGTSAGFAVTPIVVGDSLRTIYLAERLLARGINTFPIIPPGVPEKSARLRFFLSEAHAKEDIDAAVVAVAEEAARLAEEKISVTSIAERFS